MNEQQATTATVGSPRWADVPTTRQRTAIQREVTRLIDELAPQRAPARPGAALPDVQCHRLPRGCVLQGATTAVSVSWFPAAASEMTLGELQLVTWRGVVSLPGSASRRAGAEMIGELILVPVESDGGVWKWQGGDASWSTDDVVARCRALLDTPTAP